MALNPSNGSNFERLALKGLKPISVVTERTWLVGLDVLVVQRQRPMFFQLLVPDVPQFTRDLGGRDPVGVVRNQTQQEHSVVSQVEVGKSTHHVAVANSVLLVAIWLVVHLVVTRWRLVVADTSAKMVADEAKSVLRDHRANEPDQETENTAYREGDFR